jgi:hypothetical protein
MINPSSGFKVLTSHPFQKSVDPAMFPDYATIVTNPMDLARMEKKLNSDKYNTSVSLVVADIELIRENAYIYNTGIQGLEVRIMVDAMVNYFKHLLKSCFKVLQSSGDSVMIDILITPEVNMCLKLNSTEKTKDVTDYLKLVGLTDDQLVGRSSLLQLTSCKDKEAVYPVEPQLSNSPIAVPNKKIKLKVTGPNSIGGAGLPIEQPLQPAVGVLGNLKLPSKKSAPVVCEMDSVAKSTAVGSIYPLNLQ